MSRDVRVSGIRRLFSLPASGRRVERDVDDEIRFHIESRVAELVATGTATSVARDIAAREFGDVTAARAELARVDYRRLTRERRQGWWETLGQDLAYSARSLRSQPAFAAVVVLVLALGIGANVTMFGVIDHLLLRPPALVTSRSASCAWAWDARSTATGACSASCRTRSSATCARRRRCSSTFTAYSPDDMAFGRGREARELRGMRVSANYFTTLGVRPLIGRFFLPGDDGNPIAPRILVLGHGFWQRQFEGSRSAIGRTLTIGEDEYTIVGVAPEGFTGVTNAPVDAWVPLAANVTAQEYAGWLRSRQAYWLRIVGRLRPGRLAGAGRCNRDVRATRGRGSRWAITARAGGAVADDQARLRAAAAGAREHGGCESSRPAWRGVDPRAAHCLRERRESPARARNRAAA